jgi:hypothetical protein
VVDVGGGVQVESAVVVLVVVCAARGHAGPTTASWPETRDTGCDSDAVCHGSMPSTVPVDAYNRHPVHSGGRRCHTRIQ